MRISIDYLERRIESVQVDISILEQQIHDLQQRKKGEEEHLQICKQELVFIKKMQDYDAK